MSTTLFITLGVLSGCALVMLGYWLVVLFESIRAIGHLPTLRDALSRPEADLVAAATMPPVCVIVPAHNEGANIANIARTLRAQDYPNFKMVFVLDRCTDETLKILNDTLAGDDRAQIIQLAECPADWVGKVHAVYQGWLQSPAAQSADLICFADADTLWQPATLRAGVAMMAWRNLGLLSLMTNLTSDAWFEKIIQPVACYELITQYPPRRVNRPLRQRAVANGQFMMFTRDAYKAIGTHKNFRDEILEDQRMAKRVVLKKRTIGFLMSDGLLDCRMYRKGEYDRFKKGWKRIYGELAQLRPGRLRRYTTRLFTFSVALPLATITGAIVGLIGGMNTGHWYAWSVFGLCCALLVGWISLLIAGARWGGTPAWTAFLHIPGAFFTCLIMLEAARDIERGTGTTWGGRTYERRQGAKGKALAIEIKPVATSKPAPSNIAS